MSKFESWLVVLVIVVFGGIMVFERWQLINLSHVAKSVPSASTTQPNAPQIAPSTSTIAAKPQPKPINKPSATTTQPKPINKPKPLPVIPPQVITTSTAPIATTTAPIIVPPPLASLSDERVSQIIALTNQARASFSLSGLAENGLLDQAAQAKADDEAGQGYFSHVSPVGQQYTDFSKMVGYQYVYLGENLAEGFANFDDMMSAFMASPTHRANILNAHYREIGIGLASGYYEGRATLFVVQFFGSTVSQ